MGKEKFIVIAGPCVIESEDVTMEIAERLKRITVNLPIDFYFKASFDKANRTSIHSFRGLGLEKGLVILNNVKKKFNFRIITDIHEPFQAELVAEVVDIIQIPAFLCRQTDLLIAAAKTGKRINVKKAQFLAPWDMKYVIEKLETSGNPDIILSERGTIFGYNNLIVDMSSIYEMKKFGYPVIFDGTHSVQKPSGNGSHTSGNREYIPCLSQAAVASGADGLFLETHVSPDKALSDGANMLPINQVENLLIKCLNIYEVV